MLDPEKVGWPVASTVEALEAAARRCGIAIEARADAAPIWGASALGEAAFDRWVEASAGWLGASVEPVDVEHAEVDSLLLRAYPSLIRIPGADRVLVTVGRRGHCVLVLDPDLVARRVDVAELRTLLCRPIEEPADAQIEDWLGAVVESPARRKKARDLLLRELLDKTRVTRCYLIRIPPGASFWSQMRFEGLVRQALSLVAAHVAQVTIGVAAWYTLASGAFTGGVDLDWLAAWALLSITSVPIQIFTAWTQGRFLLGTATLLKRRLLAGTLRVDPDALRREGAGQLLGRSLDASAVEGLALGGGLFALLALVELILVAVVLGAGPGGWLQTLSFLACSAVTLGMAWRSFRATRRWTHARRDMTSDLVEQMVGHRTRLAQQRPERWHDGEDEALERYLTLSGKKDQKEAYVRAMPQVWLVVGLGAMLPTIVQSSASSSGLAIAAFGMLLGGGVLARLAGGLQQVGEARVAWEEVKPLHDAAARPEIRPSPVFVAAHLVESLLPEAKEQSSDTPLLDATDLVFSYPGRPQPVLREGGMQIRMGDRILLEGPSGGGKSTFASLLAGLRRPDAGLLLLEGLDWQTVGPDGWRRRVAAAPQFHESHVLSETFLFNLLMGRRWPPSLRDIEEAAQVCRELGLGDLLSRMPAGLMQMVGETGWRLSHGECSRLYIARALLQESKVVVLDESFAALDPTTVEECLRCVLARAPSVVVIAHP